jgi:hypothetical protein
MTGDQQSSRLGSWRTVGCVIAAIAALALSVHAATVGQPAPAFQAKDSLGRIVSLNQFHGKYVVLEWTNRDCPYTKKQYDSGNMQAPEGMDRTGCCLADNTFIRTRRAGLSDRRGGECADRSGARASKLCHSRSQWLGSALVRCKNDPAHVRD